MIRYFAGYRIRKLREVLWQIGLKYEMGGASSKHGSKKCIKAGKPAGEIYFETLGLYGKIISKPILRNSMWTGFIWLRMRSSYGPLSTSGFHKGG
jgi:hypothetical protein